MQYIRLQLNFFVESFKNSELHAMIAENDAMQTHIQ